MQGQSSAIGSLTESLSFDQGSTPSEQGIDQQIYWNNVRNSAPSNSGSTYANSVVSDRRNLRSWSMDEPGSSVVRNQISHNEQKAEHFWASTTRACPAGNDSENRRHESSIGLSLNNGNLSSNQIANGPLFMQSTSSNSVSQDLNINARSEGQGVDDCQIVERPLVFRSHSERFPISNHSRSGPFDLQSSEHVEGSDGGPSSLMEGRRSTRKRKATEENVGQSSGSGSSNFFQHAESSAWRAIPAPFNTGNNLTLPAPSENTAEVNQPMQVNPRLGLGVGGVSSESSPAISAAGNTEISRRNLRLRINSSQHQDSLPSSMLTVGTAAGSSSISAPRQESGLLPRSNSLSADSDPPFQSLLDHVPAMRRTLQSSRWTRSSSLRAGSTSNSAIEGNAAAPGGSSSRIIPRNRSEHPIFRTPSRVRDSVQSPNDLSVSGGNDASSSLGGSATANHQGSGNNWFPDRNSPHYPRRLSELVRRSLLSSSGSDSGGQNINISPPHSHTSDSNQEMPLPPEGQERHLSHSRSAMFLDRHVDGASGLSRSLRTLATASEGRSRLVSEIHDVLDLMRRGEGLRFEDMMILDHSVFFGMGDHHDRHRDMRLDVDNMSYEELLALEERIGNVSTGVSEETISSRLKQSKYTVSATTVLQEPEPCCICQDEYTTGDGLGELECGHSFHAECIKQWLTRKNLCPICKTTAMDSKEKAES